MKKKIIQLTWPERIWNAFLYTTIAIFGGIAAIIISPVVFIYNLAIKEKEVYFDLKVNFDQPKPPKNSDDKDDWKRAHDEEYGNDDN